MRSVSRSWRPSIAALVLLALIGGCKSTYYSAWEKLGWAKRDILVDRVEDARDEQQAAQKQFQTTLQRFQALTGFQGGELETQYNKLKAEYDRCESRAKAVSDQVRSVDEVAQDLFKEWREELNQYQSADLRRTSEQKLRDTETRYQQLITVMRRAESRMAPVLTKFRDQVLFLKHNLNAQAIASLHATSVNIEADVTQLIREMEASIKEADAFITQMK